MAGDADSRKQTNDPHDEDFGPGEPAGEREEAQADGSAERSNDPHDEAFASTGGARGGGRGGTSVERRGTEERRPAAWTPEDAATFLARAIQEGQRPLREALRRQGVPRWVFVIVVGILVAVGVVGYIHMRSQLVELRQERAAVAEELDEVETLRRNVETDRADARESAATAAARIGALEEDRARLRESVNDLRSRLERERSSEMALLKRLREENARLQALHAEQRTVLDTLRDSLAEARAEAASVKNLSREERRAFARARESARLLQAQLEGQSDEILALKKQLSAARALTRSLQGEPAPGAEAPAPDEAPARTDESAEEPVDEPADADAERGAGEAAETGKGGDGGRAGETAGDDVDDGGNGDAPSESESGDAAAM
jgi:hypothetical protein